MFDTLPLIQFILELMPLNWHIGGVWRLVVYALIYSEAVNNVFFSRQAMGEPLYRVSTGNYEYRLVLRCRQEARARFAKMRKDVLEKIELLDQKHGLLLLFFPVSYV